MNKKQKTELEDLRQRWNWNSAEAINDRNSFVLNSARKNYEKVLGESGTAIGLSRWQSECIAVCGSGNFLHTEIELAPEVRIATDYKNPAHIPSDFLKRLYASTGALALVGCIGLAVGPFGSSSASAVENSYVNAVELQSVEVSSEAPSITVARDGVSVTETPRGVSLAGSGVSVTPTGAGNLGLVGNAMKYIGAHWDCTALVEQALRDMGYSVADLAPMQFGQYGTVFYNPADVQAGDIMMRGGHVAIYAGDGMTVQGGYGFGGVVLNSWEGPANYSAFVRVG